MSSSKNSAHELFDPGTASIFYVATFFGLVAGLGQVLVFVFEKFVLGHYIHQSSDAVWVAPLASVLFFLLLAFGFWMLEARWPRIVPWWLPVFVFAVLGYWGILLTYSGQLHGIARVILAIGLAAETTHLIGDHPRSFCWIMRYSLGWMGVLKLQKNPLASESVMCIRVEDPQLTRRQFLASTGVVLAGLALGSCGWKKVGEATALAQLPLSQYGVPNVLFIVLDTVRAQSLSLYGYERMTTPNLQRLAKTGVVFQHAISTAPWTLPSHASLFTGHYPQELSAGISTPLDSTYPTLAEVFSAQGYVTAGFVANVGYCSSESGLGRGFTVYQDYDISPQNLILGWPLGQNLTTRLWQLANADPWDNLCQGRTVASEINAKFLKWLESKGSRPFFAFLNFFDVHTAYRPPEPFASIFGPTSRDTPLALRQVKAKAVPPNVLQAEINGYDSAIAYLDYEVGLLFDELEKRGVLENTLVIITSDHGEELGEHDLFGHGSGCYLTSLHVPLLISYPGRVPAGVRVDDVSSLRDIAATVVDVVDLQRKVDFPGESLARYWRNSLENNNPIGGFAFSELKRYVDGFPPYFPIAKGDMQSLVVENYHYIKNGDGREELYKWLVDPLEQIDLATTDNERNRQTLRVLASMIAHR